MEEERKPSSIRQFLNLLEGYVKKDDRGALAHLRRGFSEATEYRAWPYIAGWCRNLANDRDRRIWLTVSAGFATHLRTVHGSGNMGDVVRRLATGGDTRRPLEALKSFDGRFRRLLTCSSAEELSRHLQGIIRAAERKGIPVDFEQLFWDLIRWENPESKVRIKWAAAYWATETQTEGGEDA